MAKAVTTQRDYEMQLAMAYEMQPEIIVSDAELVGERHVRGVVGPVVAAQLEHRQEHVGLAAPADGTRAAGIY